MLLLQSLYQLKTIILQEKENLDYMQKYFVNLSTPRGGGSSTLLLYLKLTSE